MQFVKSKSILKCKSELVLKYKSELILKCKSESVQYTNQNRFKTY